MKLLDLYRSILKTAHSEADEEGFISITNEGIKGPFIVKERRLALPTMEQLRNPSDSVLLFHPLFEVLPDPESPVMAEFRRAVTERLHNSYLALAYTLLMIAASKGEHGNLTPDQSEFLSAVPDADSTMVENFEKLMEAMPAGQNQKAFCSMFIKRGGMLMGKSFHRVATVSFPLYAQLVKDGEERETRMAARKNIKKKPGEELPPVLNETYGASMRVKDREAFIKLFEYMVPEIEIADSYSATSNSNIAPFIDSVMHAVEKLSAPLNDLVARFENKLGAAAEILRVETSWVPDFVNLVPLQAEIKGIPMQPGNDGLAIARPQAAGEVKLLETEARAATTGTRTTPVVVEEEVAPPPGFKIPPRTAAVQPRAAAPFVPPPVIQQQPFQPVYHQQQPPFQQAPQQQQRAPNTGGPQDFNTFLQNNPAFAAAAAVSFQHAPQAPQQLEQPGWANAYNNPQQPMGYRQPQQQQQQPGWGVPPPNKPNGPYEF